MKSIDPASGEILRTYPEHTRDELGRRLDEAVAAQVAWAEEGFEARARALLAVADALEVQSGELALLMAEEMGKPLREGRAEIRKCAWVARFYAEHAASFLAPEPVETEAARSYVLHLPLGVILGVMPWNFPFWQVFRFAAPTLMAGNGVLIKPAPSVVGCGLAAEALLRDAGLPARVVITGESGVAELIADDRVAAVTLTGSVRAGRAVGALAGRALKKSVLELGGSDPYVVLPDADLEQAVEACVQGRLLNGGQSCIAAKRWVVVREVFEPFAAGVCERFRRVRVGDPRDESTDLGPLAREDLRDELHRQVIRSVEAGARRLLGGVLPQGPGWYYPPTVLAGVRPGMPAFDEEVFGPVGVLVEAADEPEAIHLANATRFGLGAAVFTRDVRRGERIAGRLLRAGNAFVNAFVRSDPRLPFGGVGWSGHGRELGRAGILEFTNAKTVWVR